MNYQPKTRSIYHQRDGITLLFVISMVVLFLLMGTTFVVVSNDYFKSARRRSRLSTNIVNNEALLDRAFYQLMREVPLADSSSPLRGHSILADQYGYGVKSVTAASARPLPPGPFVNVTLNVDATNPAMFSRIRIPGHPISLRTDREYFDGQFNGQVFSITSGALRGVSTRIVNSELLLGTNTNGEDDRLVITVLKGENDWRLLEANESVIINGKDFGGTGTGDVTALNFDRDEFDEVAAADVLGINALEVNQQGRPFNVDDFSNVTTYTGPNSTEFINVRLNGTGMVQPGTGFLAIDNGPNEPYDIADFQNMFLSGTDQNGMPIPSFHRDRLFSNRVPSPVSPFVARRFTFRPVFAQQVGPNAPDDATALGSTANRAFFDDYLADSLNPNGTSRTAPNTPQNLDVDSDGDGVLDSVWIDIGLPTQVDSEGVRFRPLVAYRVVDMDGRLNVNAHGSAVDAIINDDPTLPLAGRLGSGYGVADLSLSNVVIDGNSLTPPQPQDFYSQLIGARSNNIAGSTTDVRHEVGQKLFGYVEGATVNGTSLTLGSSFSTASNLAAQFQISSDRTAPNELPGLRAVAGHADLPAGTSLVPYFKDFLLGGGTGSRLFEPWEMEALLRPFDSDSNLLSSRLLNLIDPAKIDAITTDSFEVNVPSVVIAPGRRLNEILRDNSITALPMRSARIADLLPRDLRLGGKLNINRPLGNGDDDTVGGGIGNVVDDPGEVAATDQRSGQSGNPTLDLDNAGNGRTGDANARYLLARDIYITFLIACGDKAPPSFTSVTPPMNFSEAFTSIAGIGGEALTNRDYEYRKMVAQYAINLVDFRDADSIMTPFEFDLEPFDATGWDVNGNVNNTEDDGVVVWGAERPELLLTESFAFHDRQTRDTADDASGEDTTTGSDLDWDSVNAPISSAAFEIYNPWHSSSEMFASPRELGPAAGVDLGLRAGTSPVWRIALKRDRTERDTGVLRTIYFTNPTGVPGAEDKFFPTAAAGVIAPGAYVTLMPPTNPTIDPGSGGGANVTLMASTMPVAGASIPAPRVIRINSPRPLSISDLDGGYIDTNGSAVAPGTPFMVPIDTPVDSTAADLDAYNTTGIVDNFRYAFLQRLANPAVPFNANTNPYISVDSISVDLVSGNSLNAEVGNPSGEVYERMPGVASGVINTNFQLISTQRGEAFGGAADLARQNLFASDDGNPESDATDTPNPTAAIHSFGAINSSYSTSTMPFGSLTWNNRPFASVGEIANVPYLPSGLITYFFNEGARPFAPIDPATEMDVYHQHVVPFFGDVKGRDPNTANDGHRHLLRFGRPLGVDMQVMNEVGTPSSSAVVSVAPPMPLTANRFVRLFDYLETPSLFLGSEIFLDANPPSGQATAGTRHGINFFPPFHFIPQFRAPGKININTINDVNGNVWESVSGGFTNMGFAGGANSLRMMRDDPIGPTDFAGFFTSSDGRTQVPAGLGVMAEKGSAGTPFRLDPMSMEGVFDGVDAPEHDGVGSAYFQNEFRQRLTNLTTTRSSVFSIWITIGYFEIDNQGRIGREIGSDTGESSRDRAFFMVDRSIPVAFEPGRNHNVDRTILSRTIIE